MGAVNQSININTSIDTVWQELRDFHNVNWAKGVLDECEPVGDFARIQEGPERGSVGPGLEADEDVNRVGGIPLPVQGFVDRCQVACKQAGRRGQDQKMCADSLQGFHRLVPPMVAFSKSYSY